MATKTPGGLFDFRVDDLSGAVRERLKYVPRGDSISEESWRARHRNILLLLLAHLPFLFALGTFHGTEPYVTGAHFHAEPTEHVLAEMALLGGLALLAWWPRLGRRTRTAIASLGLMTSSAVLAHLSGGFIEAHFHFFVMVGVIALYEDWLPFLVGIVYVAVEHGVFGMIDPSGVYNHPDAIANPWGWALIHAVFLLGLAGAIMANWFSIERSREETRAQIENARDAEEARAEVERLNERLLVHADDLADAMDSVSDGDLTVEPPTDTEIRAIDEISDAFRSMTGALSGTILEIREFARAVERTTTSVHDRAAELARDQQQLAEDVREFAADLRAQADELDETTDELTTLSATIEEIAANAEEVSTEASSAAEAAETGTATADEAVEAIEAIERSVGELADLVDTLDGRMDDVAESTDLIDSIAEQTNTLALNANIEAARANTDGEGFAVVANEVKELADETQNHSAAIERAIEGTVEDVARVQREMEQTRAQIETGKETASDAGEAFADLTDTVEGVDHSVDEVAAATDDGARTTEEVVDAITTVVDQSREVAERSESLAERAESRAAAIAEIRSQLGDLSEQTSSLQDELDAFECDAATER